MQIGIIQNSASASRSDPLLTTLAGDGGKARQQHDDHRGAHVGRERDERCRDDRESETERTLHECGERDHDGRP
jgi:hypothetical protein